MGRSLVFRLIQAPLALLLTAGYATAACVAALADRSGHATRELGGAWSRALLRLFRVGVRVSGLEHAVAGPAVYAANHASALDILILLGHLPVDLRFIYKSSLSLVPLVGWAIWLGGHIPIDRGNPFRARRSLDAAARRIRGGTSVVGLSRGHPQPGRQHPSLQARELRPRDRGRRADRAGVARRREAPSCRTASPACVPAPSP